MQTIGRWQRAHHFLATLKFQKMVSPKLVQTVKNQFRVQTAEKHEKSDAKCAVPQFWV